jgi:hypothetical protein
LVIGALRRRRNRFGVLYRQTHSAWGHNQKESSEGNSKKVTECKNARDSGLLARVKFTIWTPSTIRKP